MDFQYPSIVFLGVHVDEYTLKSNDSPIKLVMTNVLLKFELQKTKTNCGHVRKFLMYFNWV